MTLTWILCSFSHFSSELLWRSSIYEYGILITILYFIVFIIGIRSHTLAHCSSMIAVFLNGWSWHGVFLVRGWDLYGPWPCYCSGILQVLGRHLILSALLVILIFKLAPSSFIVFGIVYRRTRMSKWTRRLLLFISFFFFTHSKSSSVWFFFLFSLFNYYELTISIILGIRWPKDNQLELSSLEFLFHPSICSMLRKFCFWFFLSLAFSKHNGLSLI